MKISEMTNDQATEAMIQLSGPFENLCNDEEVIDALDRLGKMGNQPFIKVIGSIIPMITQIGLKKHRQDIYEIVSALTMVPVVKVGKMNFGETVKALQDSYDEILRDFFSRTVIAKRITVK